MNDANGGSEPAYMQMNPSFARHCDATGNNCWPEAIYMCGRNGGTAANAQVDCFRPGKRISAFAMTLMRTYHSEPHRREATAVTAAEVRHCERQLEKSGPKQSACAQATAA